MLYSDGSYIRILQRNNNYTHISCIKSVSIYIYIILVILTFNKIISDYIESPSTPSLKICILLIQNTGSHDLFKSLKYLSGRLNTQETSQYRPISKMFTIKFPLSWKAGLFAVFTVELLR